MHIKQTKLFLMRLIRKVVIFLTLSFSAYFIINTIRIYNYSSQYNEKKSDVAIVLGTSINKGEPSSIFKERINHSIYLYEKGFVDKILYTGGIEEGAVKSESEVARSYAMSRGIPTEDILIEEISKYTTENLSQAKRIMDSLQMNNALLVSDPLHMKRGALHAKNNEITFCPSPTKTSRYKSKSARFMQLMYETFFFS